MTQAAYFRKPESIGGWLALVAMAAHCLLSILCVAAGPQPGGIAASDSGWPFGPLVICSPEGTRTIPASEAARLWGAGATPGAAPSPTQIPAPAGKDNCAMCHAVCAAAIAFLLANIVLFVASARPPRLPQLAAIRHRAPAVRLTRCRAPPAFA
ncbi:MAG TPA: hypothetical protein DDW95_13905 [Alphaproteobacteria bacterium]|nr:hypothetical protein [Alphaproteobacteria bacterium]HAM47220.1 hypothetical protein [Alphaproteobacteria bacterium]HBC53938.1 hypothetical protein [Alphaproteobacteria bacterium]HBF99636.1 hypothetical protein [Alphaproteobacteria bacterium]HCO91921.1 hypothetical protein [Alphaproteobacteria bacterium]